MKAFSFITASLLLASATSLAAVHYSELWGEHGEKWNPQRRLPDFSFAGYYCGEKALPNAAPGVSVKTFGARGDGVTDDSQAFLDALAEKMTAIERGRSEGSFRALCLRPPPISDKKIPHEQGSRQMNYKGIPMAVAPFRFEKRAGFAADGKDEPVVAIVDTINPIASGFRI